SKRWPTASRGKAVMQFVGRNGRVAWSRIAAGLAARKPDRSWNRGSRDLPPESDTKNVAGGGLGGIGRDHGGDAVVDAVVVHQGGVKLVGQGEAAELAMVCGMDCGGAALDVAAIDQ